LPARPGAGGPAAVGQADDVTAATIAAEPRRRLGDPVFRGLARLAGLVVLGVLVAIAVFLVVQALPAFHHDHKSFWTTQQWLPLNTPPVFGVAALAFGTLLSSVLALLMGFPVAFGVAVFTVEYAPRRIARALGYVTDLLAAVPSVVYGLWGLYFLVPHLTPFQRFLGHHLSFIPLFADPSGQADIPSASIFVASLVLAVMIIPIISAVSREVLSQVDPSLREAALALGATRWEMIRTAVLPRSRPGIAGAVILGLGRAIGETIAIALVLGASNVINFDLIVPGHNTIAANIATQFGEATPLGRAALIASGLVLFAMTMVVTLAARGILARAGAVERSVAV
jgi:phosphate transport system permease protein